MLKSYENDIDPYLQNKNFYISNYKTYLEFVKYYELLEEDTIIDIAELFKVFADSTRVKIINVLLENKLCVSDIATLVGGTQSAISHQLRILKSAKLVKYTKIGKTVYYELSDDHVKKLFNIGKEHINEI